jgi:hypothetical protein
MDANPLPFGAGGEVEENREGRPVGLRSEGAARGPDGTKGFALLRTRQRRVPVQERVCACALWMTNAGRGTRASVWRSAVAWTGHCVSLWCGGDARGTKCFGGWAETLWGEALPLVRGMWQEVGSLWEEARSLWRRKQSEALRVALLALFAVVVQIVTGVGYVAACFLAVLLMLPCAFLVLVFGAGCVHVWTLVRWTPSMAHIEAPAGTFDWRCLAGGCYGRTDVSLMEEGGMGPVCLLGGEEEEFEIEDACAFGRHWCRHTSGLSRKRTRTAAAETGCRRRKASAQLQSKVWDPGRSLGAKCLAVYSLTG